MNIPLDRPKELGRFILAVLRHCPDQYGLTMDGDGWVETSELAGLLAAYLNSHTGAFDRMIDEDDLLLVIEQCGIAARIEWQRFRTRASYGHSTPAFQPSHPAVPMFDLVHVTDESCWPNIQAEGLSPMNRRFVHLTSSFGYANRLAASKPQSLRLRIDTAKCNALALTFYRQNAQVWISEAIPPECIELDC